MRLRIEVFLFLSGFVPLGQSKADRFGQMVFSRRPRLIQIRDGARDPHDAMISARC